MNLRGRALGLTLSALVTLGVGIAPPTVAASDTGAVTWGPPDHKAKTIPVSVRLQIYSACDTCPRKVTPFIAETMRKEILAVWNQHHKYRCYELVFSLSITLGTDRFHVDDGRLGVRFDNGPVPIRSYVSSESHDPTHWRSNDPADRVVPVNSWTHPSTWSKGLYAHEFGHVIGLSDAYEDHINPANGENNAAPYPDAPLDVMSKGELRNVSQETIDRLVERSPIDRASLRCGWTYNGDTPIGKHRGTKCDGLGGEWTIQGLDVLAGAGDVTSLWNVTINEATLAGSYKHEKIQTLPGSVTTSNAAGKARIALNADGSILMTLDAAPITLKTTVPGIGSKSVVVPGQVLLFPWENDTGGACP